MSTEPLDALDTTDKSGGENGVSKDLAAADSYNESYINDLTGEIITRDGTTTSSVDAPPTTVVPGSVTGNRSLPSFVMRREASSRLVSLGLLLLLSLSIATPLAATVGYGVNAYVTYTALRAHGASGIQHLLNVKTLFTGRSAHLSDALDTNRLSLAGREFAAARHEFEVVRSLIDHTEVIQTITQFLPQYRSQVATARAASQIGIDIADIGQDLTTTATTLAPTFRGPLLEYSRTPLITSGTLATVGSAIDTVLPLVDDIQKQIPSLSIDALPVSAHQRGQVLQLIQLLPQVRTALAQGRDLLSSIGWFLGVDGPRTFLVQTMDRSELRPTGGFTGQYGELQIDGGRVAPFSLKDIALLEYADNNPTADQLAPEEYRSWWPFANWGLRDSNLSADFPTSAQFAITQYQRDVGQRVDGVILFTPFLIARILQVLGPITLPAYNETITAQNLEARLHYYQLDNEGIHKEEIIEHIPDTPDGSALARKRFTALLAHTLIDRVRHASPTELLELGQQALSDLKTKDIQIYVQNTPLEEFLMQYGYAAQVDRSTSHDGLYVVQANVSASKASQYVKTSIHDTVSLDATGGATHTMQLRLVYNQIGPVYGLDTYRDYMRVYVPPSAQFLWGDGFDSGKPLCGGPLPACQPTHVYPRDELLCPPGQYSAGVAAPMLGDPYAGLLHPLDTVGPPTNFTSDEHGRAMFAGFVVVPKNCMITVTLSWYVPPPGPQPYNLLIQRQAGTFPELDLTILPTPVGCTALNVQGMHTDRILTEDATFSLRTDSSSKPAHCYSQPGA